MIKPNAQTSMETPANSSEIFVVCVGGNGSMIMESLVHMCAINQFDIKKAHLLMVDVDSGNGNVDRAIKTQRKYQSLWELFTKNGEEPPTHQLGFLKTEVALYKWMPMQQNAAGSSSLSELCNDNWEVEWLAQQLYDEEELTHTVAVGFKGHPNLGVVFMDILQRERGEDEEFQSFINAFIASDESKMFFAGSCFGGTGASGIPSLVRYIKKQLKDTEKADMTVGALLLLPYFDMPKSSDANEILHVNSAEFNDKVKTVLNYYMGALGAQDEGGLYQKLYLLGAPDGKRIYYNRYATGASNQNNPANFFTWFATSAVKQFFEDGGIGNERLMISWLPSLTDWGWKCFSPTLFPTLEQNSVLMLQACMLYIIKLYHDVNKLTAIEPYSFFDNYLGDNISVEELQIFKDDMQTFSDYIALLISWFFQIATHLPGDSVYTLEDDEAVKPFALAHGCDEASLQNALADLIALTKEDERGAKEMLSSLVFQQFFNAFLLCALEEKRLEYWPLEEEDGSDAIAKQRAQILERLFSKNLRRVTDIALTQAIDHLTENPVLKRGTSLEDLTSSLKAECSKQEIEPENAARALLRNLFGVLEANRRGT